MRIATLAGLVLCVALALSACGGGGNGDGGGADTVSGTVSSPAGQLAGVTPRGWQRWLAALGMNPAWAAISGFSPVPNATVYLLRIDRTGAPVGSPAILAETTTNVAGQYSLTLPTGVTFASDLVVQITNAGAPQSIGSADALNAPVVGNTVDVDPISEGILREVIAFLGANPERTLADFSALELSELQRVITAAITANPALVGTTAAATIANISAALAPSLNNAIPILANATNFLVMFSISPLPDGEEGVPYSQPVLAMGNPGTLAYSVTGGSLPAGLSLDGASGQISGTPTAAGVFSVTVQVSLVSGALSPVQRALSLSIVPAATPPAGASLAAGDNFSLARLANGNLVSWGDDVTGQLGAGNGDQTRNTPGNVLASNVTSVAAGAAHALAVRATGEVFAWGYNGFGQLGFGDDLTSQEAPVNVNWEEGGSLVTTIDAVAACGGTLHSLILRGSGQVRAMGYNAQGQIGNGTNAEAHRGVVVSGIDGFGNQKATAIACGGNHSLALMQDGTVRAWGGNGEGQLGDGTSTDRSTPVTVSGLSGVTAVSAGLEHSMALKSDGTVWAWGSNLNGKLGDGTDTDRPQPVQASLTGQYLAIAAGGQFSLALRDDGVVFVWGINEVGQLGTGSLSPGARFTPAQVPAFCPSAGKVVEIATSRRNGLEHALARCENGTVWAWGYNDKGQIGNGSGGAIFSTPAQVSGLDLN